MKLNFSITIFTLFAAICFVSGVSGQRKNVGVPGTEMPLYEQKDADGYSCYAYKNYVVRSINSEGDIGDDILIFKRNTAIDSKKNCARPQKQAYMRQVSTDNSSFDGLTGDLFFVDNGTSAGERGLDIVSVSSRKVVHSLSYYGEPTIVKNALIYDKYSSKKGSLKICPNALKWRKIGGGEAWVRPVRLDLTTFKETPAGNLKCIYQE